ncbi:hypothetical protein [Streptomyces sp. A1136]|uniref:hypothetical protein n=1 Tax=Streptomyces sp. A1136 TaxID=2563102 RepID=UPI001F0D2058|nr:hypothetical protein [Streptomyces sp. A1136]
MRPSRDLDTAPAASHTPIYDLLYSEYLRAFRALPGDRSGEEDLGFTSFSYGGTSTGFAYSASTGGSAYGNGWTRSSWQPAEGWQPAYAPTPQPLPQPSYAYAGSSGGTGGYDANGNGRQHQTGMHHIPAALPPAPRRGY